MKKLRDSERIIREGGNRYGHWKIKKGLSFYNRISDGNGVPPYVWGEADLAVGGVRVLDPSYAGKLTVLPKAKGVLLEVED